MTLYRLEASAPDFATALAERLARDEGIDAAVPRRVSEIIERVRAGGDEALLALTAELDRLPAERVADLEMSSQACEAALAELDTATREALLTAADRIRDYHRRQVQESWDFTDDLGNVLGQRVTPMARVGVYVPGGKASYPSSVLMNIIPAKVAGVPEVIMVVPAPEGVVNPVVLAAAAVAGADRVFTIGGAQAIAALALGTQTVPRVDKIVGPGNTYVATAKRQLFGQVGLDMIAGPSEVVIVCDGETDPTWVALDLFSQAEHDELAQSILISPDAAFLDRVDAAMTELLPTMARETIIRRSLADRGAAIRVRDLDEALTVSNRIAPEHLQLSVAEPAYWLERVQHAGAVFLGRHTAEVLGDYCAGPNHVLPTAGTARFSSPLGVYDFQKRTSVIHCSPDGAATLGRVAETLARGESLDAHARSAACRVTDESQDPAAS